MNYLDLNNLRSLGRRLLRLPNRLAANACTVKEFTALFAVDDLAGVTKAIEAQQGHLKTRYSGVLGLHNLRFYLVDTARNAKPRRRNEPAVRKKPEQPNLLVFAAVYDGDREDFLNSLVHRAGDSIHEIFRHCRGYRGPENTRQFLASRRIDGGYFFRDLGKIEGLGTDPEFEGDASTAELSDALRVQQAFEGFYAAHPPSTPARELREAFKQAFDAHRTSLPLGRFERSLPGEARYARKIGELTERLQERTRIKCQLNEPIRGAQAKAHGLAQATFKVNPALDPKFRYGIFATPGVEFRALLRPANGYHEKQDDRKFDSRALTVSVDLNGKFDDAKWAELVGEERPVRKSQDFLLFSHPIFFAPDVSKFVLLMGILTNGPSGVGLLRLVHFIIGHKRTREVRVFGQMFLRRLLHPLEASFHSGTPYMLGPDQVVKYAVEPRDPRSLKRFGKPSGGPDCLRGALEASVHGKPIVLDFYVYALSVKQPSERLADAVEDATVDWTSRNYSPKYGWEQFGRPLATKVHVATITVNPVASGPASADEWQASPTSEDAIERAEKRVANPWNALEAHRPVGNLNRARYFIYRDGAKRREETLGLPVAVALHAETVRPSQMPDAANDSAPRRSDSVASLRPLDTLPPDALAPDLAEKSEGA